MVRPIHAPPIGLFVRPWGIGQGNTIFTHDQNLRFFENFCLKISNLEFQFDFLILNLVLSDFFKLPVLNRGRGSWIGKQN